MTGPDNTSPPYPEDDEITLRELILKLQEYAREVWKHWKLVALIILPFVAYFLIKALLTPVTYPAKLTFMVNEEGGSSAISGILGQFGLGGGGGGGKYNLDKIVELARSRRIVQGALFQKETLHGKEDFFANHLIREYDLHKQWEKDTTGLNGFLFKNGAPETFSRLENKVLKSLHGRIIGDPENKAAGLFSISYDEETGIFSMSVTGASEEFSLALVERLYDELSRFYIEKSTEKQQQTYDIAKAKADSFKSLLDSKQYQLLKFDDSQKNLVMRTSEASKYQLQRDLQVYAVAYGEALKNVEYADFALKSATPFFQVIDLPIGPIGPDRKSKIKALLLGGLLGGFLGAGFVIGKKVYREAMREE